jgi:hypothetical protein
MCSKVDTCSRSRLMTTVTIPAVRITDISMRIWHLTVRLFGVRYLVSIRIRSQHPVSDMYDVMSIHRTYSGLVYTL